MAPPAALLNDEPSIIVEKQQFRPADCVQNNSHYARQHDYIIPDKPIGSRRHLRVVCVGAGYSGLMTAIMIHEKMADANVDLTLYERHADLGGTWLVSRYP